MPITYKRVFENLIKSAGFVLVVYGFNKSRAGKFNEKQTKLNFKKKRKALINMHMSWELCALWICSN